MASLVAIVVVLVGYGVGSIPSAYLITRWMTGRDLRNEGSRNIGTRNAYEVTGRKGVGVFVLVCDVLKGLAPVAFVLWIGWEQLLPVLVPSLIFGHCYPVWLRFHGGKGLATSAGAMLLSFPGVLVAWVVGYFLMQRVYDEVNIDSVIACLVTLAGMILLPDLVLHPIIRGVEPDALGIGIGVTFVIILSRHVMPIVRLRRGSATRV